MRKRLFHFVLPASVTLVATAWVVHYFAYRATGDAEYAQLATAYIVTICGLLLVVFVQPPTKAWVGGDVLSGDRRPAQLVMGLFVLFIVIAFIPLAQRFLNVEPLRQLDDYAVIAIAVIIWAFTLRLIWRSRLWSWIVQRERRPLAPQTDL
jgi:cation-transporting ATPase E